MEAIADALGEASVEAEISGLCLALAGVARPDDHAAWRGAVARWIESPPQRIAWSVSLEDSVITHDAMAALVGGTGRKEGVVVIAGTGAIAFGVNARGDERRASGWGYLLGDEGSGYWIGLEGLRAVCRAEDGRGETTKLTDVLLAAKGLDSPRQLVRQMYGEWKPVDVASLAPVVLSAAAQGDAVSRDIVELAAAELSNACLTVLRALGLVSQPSDVVTTGGLWDGALLRARFAERVSAASPGASVIPPRAEPVAGALLLARGLA
jgi:N-acetylglucosamine kinase